MPSPFPGMDPFIEGQRWESFHHGYIEALGDLLVPLVRPRYIVDVEERVYIDFPEDEPGRWIRPDVSVGAHDPTEIPARQQGRTAVALMPVTARLTLPAPADMQETFLSIRSRESRAVVVAIELLSPSNKRPGHPGRAEYLRKRGVVLGSDAHLVEIDLLRGGDRLPVREPLPPGDYYALISRALDRPRVDVYAWSLETPLPTLPIPLRGDDPDVALDLQAALDTVYDRRGYDYVLDYDRPVEPPLSPSEAEWVDCRLLRRGVS